MGFKWCKNILKILGRQVKIKTNKIKKNQGKPWRIEEDMDVTRSFIFRSNFEENLPCVNFQKQWLVSVEIY